MNLNLILADAAQATQPAQSEGAADQAVGWAEAVGNWVITYGPKIVGVLLFLFAAWLVAGLCARLVTRAVERARVETTLARFFGSMTKWIVLVLALIACLGVFGVETTSFAAVIGAGTLAIGLAFQGSLSNLAAGVMLLIFRPFKVGDLVDIAGTFGKVDEIELFTTKVNTTDNRLIILPNGQVFGAVIENVNFHPTRRVDVAVGAEYPADIDKTREVLTAAVGKVENVLADPEPAIVLTGLGDSSVDWAVRVWVNTPDYWAVREQLIRSIKYSLDEAGIGIPYPQMDVHVDGTLTRGDG